MPREEARANDAGASDDAPRPELLLRGAQEAGKERRPERVGRQNDLGA